jgi:hypothetical protein
MGEPAGRLPDMDRPQVLSSERLATAWLAARRLDKPVLRLKLPGGAGRAWRQGDGTCPGHRRERSTWRAWLAGKHGPGPFTTMAR